MDDELDKDFNINDFLNNTDTSDDLDNESLSSDGENEVLRPLSEKIKVSYLDFHIPMTCIQYIVLLNSSYIH